MEKKIKKYVVCFKHKSTNEVKYFAMEGTPSYDIINNIKYKKKMFDLTDNINCAMNFSEKTFAETCIHSSIIEYRRDLLDTYDIYVGENSIDVNEVGVKDVVKVIESVIYYSLQAKHSTSHENLDASRLVKYLTEDNTLAILDKAKDLLKEQSELLPPKGRGLLAKIIK